MLFLQDLEAELVDLLFLALDLRHLCFVIGQVDVNVDVAEELQA